MSNFSRSIQNKIANLAAIALARFGPIAAERYKRATGRVDVPQYIQEQLIQAARVKRKRRAYKRRSDYHLCIGRNMCLSNAQCRRALSYDY